MVGDTNHGQHNVLMLFGLIHDIKARTYDCDIQVTISNMMARP